MNHNPAWATCPHLSAGTCPQLTILGGALFGGLAARPELNQDLALEKLTQACANCSFSPPQREHA